MTQFRIAYRPGEVFPYIVQVRHQWSLFGWKFWGLWHCPVYSSICSKSTHREAKEWAERYASGGKDFPLGEWVER